MNWDNQTLLAMHRYLQQLGLNPWSFIEMDAHYAVLSGSTMSMLRMVWVPSLGQYVVGEAMVGGGAIAAGALPVIFEVGVFVALGAPYYQARELAKEQNTKAGFAQGFVMGVLNWEWGHAVGRFARKYLRINPNDPQMDRIRVVSYNAGLKSGFAAGAALPEDTRKQFRIKFRELAGRADSGSWSKNADAARLQQIDYVIALAGAALKHNLIKE
jgi:hypothetical protein